MNKKIKRAAILSIVVLLLLLTKSIVSNNVASVEDYQKLINSYGYLGPVLLTLFQAFQVVVPVVPGYLGCAAGAVSFGSFVGFLCNYVGISAGSIVAFLLARRYGEQIVLMMFSEEQFVRIRAVAEGKKSYDWFLFIATLLPLFPDDFLCYFSGLTSMSRRRFITIIIIGKPWCILAYSLGFGLLS